jgi:hypothetical protein
MEPRLKASLLWGLVGGLAFLVLVQGYELLADRAIAATIKAGVAVAVAALATVVTHVVRPYVLARFEGS